MGGRRRRCGSPADDRALGIAAARKAIEIDKELSEGHAAVGFAKLFNREMAAERYVTPMAPAATCLALDDLDCFFHYLERAFQERSNYIAFRNLAPPEKSYPAVRRDPRFQAMLRRLGS